MQHQSDCAQHNMPAYPNGPCDCGYELTKERDQLRAALAQCESLLSELADGGAENPELEIARAALAGTASSNSRDGIAALKSRIDLRLNNHLVEMEAGYDDSITGFNEAWEIVVKAFGEAITKAALIKRA